MPAPTSPRRRNRAALTLPLILPLTLAQVACVGPKIGDLGELSSASATTSDGTTSDGTTGDTAAGTTVGVSASESTNATSEGDTQCPFPLPDLGHCGDVDGDAVTLEGGDNAPKHGNPQQWDADGDGIGDPADLCPLLASEPAPGDADLDGQGDPCDRCAQPPAHYHQGLEDAVPVPLWITPGPLLRDHDGDGIGDACDNCPTIPNCGDYDLEMPHQLGEPIPDDPALCQKPSAIQPLIGEACFGVQGEGAAGPVGFGPLDDFDQDGLVNQEDGCPRDPVAGVPCEGDEACPDASVCHPSGICTHIDHDGDGVGDRCDTCPHHANADQITAEGRLIDDADGDRIGLACEPGSKCAELPNPRPIDFYMVSVAGLCCVTTFPGPGALVDPDGVALSPACDGIDPCRPLPAVVVATPGVVTLPPGCDEALAALGLGADENERLTPEHPLIGGSLAKLMEYQCLLPPLDQDFDGLGDACDLCPFAFDPNNEPYIAPNLQLFPDLGKYCNGDYDPELHCTCP